MGTIASQITSLTIVYSTVYSDADQRKHQSSASLAFVWGIHRGPVNSPHKWPVTRKMLPFDDVIMINVNVGVIKIIRISTCFHVGDMKHKHNQHCWNFVRRIHRLSVVSPHKGKIMQNIKSFITSPWAPNGEVMKSMWRLCNEFQYNQYNKSLLCASNYFVTTFLSIEWNIDRLCAMRNCQYIRNNPRIICPWLVTNYWSWP